MTLEKKIIELIEPALNSLGYELVRVMQIGAEVLQIMIDKDGGVNIEDCSKATKLIRNILHVAEMNDLFNLEVSSPGIERPLIKPEHYQRFIGNDVKLKTSILVDGQKKIIGKLTDFNSETNQITLTCDNKVVTIELSQVQSTNLYFK